MYISLLMYALECYIYIYNFKRTFAEVENLKKAK